MKGATAKRGERRTFLVTDNSLGGNVYTWLDLVEFKAINDLARKRNVSRSAVLREAVRNYLRDTQHAAAQENA